MLKKGEVFYTSYIVVDEALTVIAMRVSKPEAVKFLHAISSPMFPIILEYDDALRDQTYALFRSVADKNISGADCSSAVLMKRYGISMCYTFDKHFKKLGVNTL